jgi:hypothetical protein
MLQKIVLSIALALPLAASSIAFADTTEDDVTWINQCIADNKREGATEDVVRKYCVCMDNAMAKDETRRSRSGRRPIPTRRRLATSKPAGSSRPSA